MRLVTFQSGDREAIGALVDHDCRIVDLAQARRGYGAFASMQELIEAGPSALVEARSIVTAPPPGAVLPTDAVRLLSPIPRPIKLRDCQLFPDHVDQCLRVFARKAAATSEDPEASYRQLRSTHKFSVHPVIRKRVIYYNCDSLAVAGHGEDIIWPRESSHRDYELEFACIIGKSGRNILAAAARDHIFGYTLFNDFSARDVQFSVMGAQLGPGAGKDFDRSNVLGPCIVTAEEIGDAHDLTMIARVNGEEWSRGSSSSMSFTFEQVIEDLSRDRMLYAGEILGSGTVAMGSGFELGRSLEVGDVVELEIPEIGILRNRVGA